MVEDAADIYRIIVNSFYSTSLKYTIYQSSKSIKYLRDQIKKSQDNSNVEYCVARANGEPLGFYNAVEREKVWFLNHIAVADNARNLGVGQSLLDKYEESANKLCYKKVGLEVFQSNNRGYGWYQRKGYMEKGARYLYRYTIGSLWNGNTPKAIIEAGNMERALLEECSAGFSLVKGKVAQQPIILGLINGDVCNIIDYEDMEILQVARAAANTMYAFRKWIIMKSAYPIQESVKPESYDISIYMEKNVTK